MWVQTAPTQDIDQEFRVQKMLPDMTFSQAYTKYAYHSAIYQTSESQIIIAPAPYERFSTAMENLSYYMEERHGE